MQQYCSYRNLQCQVSNPSKKFLCLLCRSPIGFECVEIRCHTNLRLKRQRWNLRKKFYLPKIENSQIFQRLCAQLQVQKPQAPVTYYLRETLEVCQLCWSARGVSMSKTTVTRTYDFKMEHAPVWKSGEKIRVPKIGKSTKPCRGEWFSRVLTSEATVDVVW